MTTRHFFGYRVFATLLTGLLLMNSVWAQEKTTLQYVGSSTIANYIRNAEQIYPKVDFELDTEPESAGGEQAVLEGRCDLAGVAKVPRSEVLAKGMVSTLIGWDAIAVITHPDNPVKDLTQEQLRSIFSGEILNWKEVGGADLAIQTYTVSNESATRKVFRSIILGETNYENDIVVKPDRDVIERVKNDPAGIGHISFSFLAAGAGVQKVAVEGFVPDVNNPSYPIKRPLYLLWWPGRVGVADFVSWTLSDSGQSTLKKNFVGISQGIVHQGEELGALVVYTQTDAVEDGGFYYYPHKPYELLRPDRSRVRRVPNRRNNNDEDPENVRLIPGVYIVLPEMADGSTKEFYVTIESGKTTSSTLR